MSNDGMIGILPRPYYLPDLVADSCKESHLGFVTDAATVHDYSEDGLSLSGTTQVGDPDANNTTAKPQRHRPTLLNALQQREESGSTLSQSELLEAHFRYTSNPTVRAADQTSARTIDPVLSGESSSDTWKFWDFVHQGQDIHIKGTFGALFDLDQLTQQHRVGGPFVRHWTSGDGLLCGLHALVISINAILRTLVTARARQPYSLELLQEILAGEPYRQRCMLRAHTLASSPNPPDAETLARHEAELTSPSNLSVEQLSLLVTLVGEAIGHPLQLGVVASHPPADAGHHNLLYTAYEVEDNSVQATTVWLVNECYGGDTLNHWSGMAPGPLASQAQVAKQTPQLPRTSGDRRHLGKPVKKVGAVRVPKRDKARPKRTVPAHASKRTTPPPPATGIFCPHSTCKRHHQNPFKKPRDLKHHENTAHIPYEERKHVCGQCSQRFVFRKDVKRHTAETHDRSQSHYCLVAECTMAGPDHCQRGWNLWRHYSTVHRDDPHLWQFCRAFFGLGEKGKAGARGSSAT